MQLWEKAKPIFTRYCIAVLFVLINLLLVLLIYEFISETELPKKLTFLLSGITAGTLLFSLRYHALTQKVSEKLTPFSTTLLLLLLSLRYFDPQNVDIRSTFFIFLLPILFIVSGYGLLTSKPFDTKLKLPYYAVLSILFLLFIVSRLYNLHIPYFHGDEYETISAAYSFAQTGDFYKWDWIQEKPGNETDCITTVSDCRYTRAWPFTVTVAGVFKLLGVSEWSARLPSVLYSLLALLFVFKIMQKIAKSNTAAFITIILIGFSPYFIETARFARMYTMLWFVFFGSIYALVLAREQKTKNKQFLFLTVGMVGMVLSYIIHPVTLVMLPGMVLSTAVLLVQKYGFSKKYLLPVITGLLLGTLLIVLNQTGLISLYPPKYLTILSDPQFDYLPLISRPFHILASVFIISIGMLIAWKKQKLIEALPIILTGGIALVFFVFFGGRYMHANYVSLITILMYMLLGLSLSYLTKFSKHGLLVTILCIGITLFSLSDHYQNIYAFDRNYGKYPVAYQSIIDKYEKGDVIIGQLLRTYYLQDPRLKDAIIIDMGRGKTFTLDDLKETLTQYPSGFLVWDTLEENANVDRELRRYACANFTQLHGENCPQDKDKSKVEAFEFNQSVR